MLFKFIRYYDHDDRNKTTTGRQLFYTTNISAWSPAQYLMYYESAEVAGFEETVGLHIWFQETFIVTMSSYIY